MPALRRLARRSTVQELKCLDTLAGLQLGQSGSMTIKQLLDEVDAKLAAAKSEFVVDRPAADTVSLDAKVEVSRNSNALDQRCDLLDDALATAPAPGAGPGTARPGGRR